MVTTRAPAQIATTRGLPSNRVVTSRNEVRRRAERDAIRAAEATK
jgi:hypothetical protein